MWDTKRSCITVLILSILLSIIVPGSVKAQDSDILYFEETGHSIGGVVLDFFLDTEDALTLFGFPITEEFIDKTNGQHTQYFQHVRLDIYDTPQGEEVKIAPLGSLLYDEAGTPVSILPNNPSCKTFAATKKRVCYDFLRFYQEHEGQIYFGEPISDMEERNGRIVQYFENVRLEWRPELPVGQKVGLSNLGRFYYDQRVGGNGLDDPFGRNIIKSAPVNIHANAFVTKALIPANNKQKMFIIVQDQNLQPVQGAMVKVTVHLPGKLGDAYRAPMTNKDGISILEFPVGDIPVKQIVNIDVHVDYEDMETNTTSWFRIWW